jgi:branched-chain amino acid transport system permease protein
VETILSGQLLFAALVTGSIYILLGFGLNIVFGTMRLLNVAHGEMAMIGAYISFTLFDHYGVSPLISMLLAGAVTAALGALVYRGIFRKLLATSRSLARLEANSLLIFLGLSIILQNSASAVFTASPRAYRYLDHVWRVENIAITQNRLLVVIVALVLCVAAGLFLARNIYGLAIKAYIQNPQAAMVMGINIDRIQLLSFCIGFASAGIAGSLLSMLEQISPFMGFSYTIAAFVVVILGGLGNLIGGAMAGLLLGVLETYGVALTSPNLQLILIYGVFVLVLIFRPQGITGSRMAAR